MKNYILSIVLVCVSVSIASAQEPKNTLYQGGSSSIPKPVFGEYTVGDDYFLANYQQLLQYADQVAKISDRMMIERVGTSTEGRPFNLMIVSSPENLKNIEEYRQISVKLAKAEGLTDEQARQLAAKGKAVVWIDGGLHATEVINSQALFVQIWDLLARNDAETLRILDNVIILFSLINPDGMDLVSDWYMKESDPKKRNTRTPVMYQKYAGHDNNRDSYMVNLVETEIINRLQFIEWIPQIVYNQHQTGPTGTVLFVSPIRDPFNHNQDPLVHLGVDLVGTAIHHRFLAEGKGGAVKREAASYSTWYNGGVRTTVGFHNQIGLIHEIIGSPTPMSIPVVPNFLVPVPNNPLPIGPQQVWHQYQSIEYVLSANRAVLDLAARQGDELLYRIYRAGKNSIERGSKDYWTVTPKWIDQLSADIAASRKDAAETPSAPGAGGRVQDEATNELYNKMFTQDNRDPRGYILSADQVDFPTATKFIQALQKTGIDVHRATGNFTVAGKNYPAGSYVIKAAQAFRPHLRDMLEPQDHPNEFQYPGGPPVRPYDAAGWTLAYQMDVRFDRILDAFDGPFEKIEDLAKVPAGKVSGASKPSGYLLSHQINDAFVATTRLLAAKEEVYWLQTPFTTAGKKHPVGTIYIPAKGSTATQIQKLADELGLNFDAITSKPNGAALKLRPVKVALWDTFGGSMPSGWIRWLLEQGFPFSSFEVVFPSALDAGKLRAKYDVIILPPGAFSTRPGMGNSRTPENLPAQYQHMVGSVTADVTGPQLRSFVEEGGTILAIGSSTAIGSYLELPISNALVELLPNGTERPLGSDKYYVPGSVLRVKVDNTQPIAYGVSEDLDIIFANNPVFRLQPDAGSKGVKSVSWFPNAEPLRSGWAWGQHYLKDGTSVVEAAVGKGKVFLFGPEITYRAQPHGSFKFLFNGIYYSGAAPVVLK